MKKITDWYGYLKIPGIKKSIRVMKITGFLLMLSVVSVIASEAYSQTELLNLKVDNGTVKDVLSEIENQSEFYFMYSGNVINDDRKVSVSAKNQKIDAVLDQLFAGDDIDYIIRDRIIVLTTPEVFHSQREVASQQKAVSGTVTDESGEPLPGVTVVVKGTTQGTVTDGAGNYSLTNIHEEAILVFSFVGMQAQEIVVENQTEIDVTMVVSAIGIEEVVAIGYGTMKKSDLTGSVTSVSSEELISFPTLGVNQAIQGRASGVQVTSKNGEPGSGTRIRIRGGTSLNASSDPLYVVDGFAGGAVPPPEDIEAIEVLKDASATAIYGSRGANGVILITTKSGKTGMTQIEFNSSYSFDQIAKKIDLLNATEFAELINEVYVNMGDNPPYSDPESFGEGTDWQDVIYRKGNLHKHQLSASGGTEDLKFYSSLSYYDQDGIVINSNYKRYSGLANIDFTKGENLNIGTRFHFQRSIQDGVKSQEGSGGTENTSVISGALIMEPITGIYNDDGEYNLSVIGDPNDNPYAVAQEYTRETVSDLFQGNGFIDLTLMEGLVFKTTLGVRINNNRTGTYSPTTLNAGINVGGDADISAIKSTSILNENYFSYNQLFNDVHEVNVMAGYSYQTYRYESWSASNNGYVTDSYLFWNLDGGADYQQPASGLTEWNLASFYGRVNYDFRSKYLLTFTGRYDGSSRFGKNNKWAFFPSGALAWNVKQEPFLEPIDVLSHFKLRLSYGVTGNTDIGIYQSLANFSSTQAIIDETTVNAVVPSTVANSDLSWESTKQTDIGLDAGLWDEKLIITADYYIKKTEDLLYEVPLPEYSGYRYSLRNIGSVENKGFEFGLSTTNIQRKNFNWTSDFNISFNENEVLSLPGGELIYSRRPGHLIGDATHILTEGAPAGSFYGYLYDGVDDEGSPVYKDIASRDADGNLIMEPDDEITGDDRTIIGNPHPDFIVGFNNDLRYKNFDLNFFFQGVFGNDILNFTRMELEWVNGKSNQMVTVLNRWSPTNTDTDIPKASGTYSSISSSRWIEEGTYLRLKNLSLGYTVTGSFLNETGIDKLRVFISGQNLFTITDYSGYNPDISYRDGNISLGLDYGSYPNTRSMTVGLNLIF